MKNNVQTIMSTLPDVHIILQRIHSGAIFITKVVIGSIVSSHPASGTTYCIEMQGLCRHITSHWCCYQRSEHWEHQGTVVSRSCGHVVQTVSTSAVTWEGRKLCGWRQTNPSSPDDALWWCGWSLVPHHTHSWWCLSAALVLYYRESW